MPELPRYIVVKEGFHYVIIDAKTGENACRGWFHTQKAALKFIERELLKEA